MTIAVDFSFARPTVAELQKASVAAVLRYLTGLGKAISLDELESYLTAGIPVGFVFEVGVDDVAGGAAAGTQHAQQALAALAVLRISGCPAYFAVDEDVDPQSAVPYFQGINAVMPPSEVGCYGEGALIVLLFQLGLATYGWLSESTSFPGYQAALNAGVVNIEQSTNNSPVPGTDLNFILKSDFGQWPRPAPDPSPQPGAHTMAVSALTGDFKQGQIDGFQTGANALWHKYWQNGVEHNEKITTPAGRSGAVGEPKWSIIGGALYVFVEDANEKAWGAVQAAGSSTWAIFVAG